MEWRLIFHLSLREMQVAQGAVAEALQDVRADLRTGEDRVISRFSTVRTASGSSLLSDTAAHSAAHRGSLHMHPELATAYPNTITWAFFWARRCLLRSFFSSLPAFSMYLAHLELMNLSAVSSAWASSIHWAASLMFPACCTRKGVQKGGKRESSHRTRQAKTMEKTAAHHLYYLVDLGLDDEQLYERGRALDGGVDVLKGERLLANHVVVLRQERDLRVVKTGGQPLLKFNLSRRYTCVASSMRSSFSSSSPTRDVRALVADLLLVVGEVLQGLLVESRFSQHLVLVEQQLAEVVGDGVADPGGTLRRSQLEQLSPTLGFEAAKKQ
ncbi:hypothetical protein CRUP_024721 [Coryphaenoides rupestris]|nr:hypothetical protein CRUP_024721 [Coryphaenoides rupestris]